MGILNVRGVERRFETRHGSTLALQATDLDVAENDFITILGPSGCGKSTLLRIVAGLDVPSSGEVLLDGRCIEGPGADRGMVFQSYTLFPWLTVLDNVCFGLRERGLARAQQLEVAHGYIAGWACAGSSATTRASCPAACSSALRWPERWPTTPRMLLMDEPFGALDTRRAS
jgi:ABC-type nitrate/sulfonate/bicarbonate transport system ATPase subunit